MLQLPQSVLSIIKTFTDQGFECFAVGGSIRDLLLNRPTHAWDFTTNATPQEIQKLFPDCFYDNEFGTVGIKIRSSKRQTNESWVEDVYEVTTYRHESDYTDKRHPDKVTWGKSLEEDLGRRDFTIGAIAYDGKKLIDPYQGQLDLEQNIVRCVGNPDTRFHEDALRILRAIRIATELGFTIEPATFTAIQQNVKLLKNISADRLRQELMHIMKSHYPSDGIMLLKNAGIIAQILPELETCFGVPQQSPKRHHIYDVGTHLILSLKHCPSVNPVVRFATLLHDIGKPLVFHKDEPSKLITFYNHEVVGARITKNIAKRLNFSNKDTEKLITLVRWHQFTVDENQTDATLRRFIRRVGIENLQDMLDLRIGDRLGGGARETSWRLRLYMKRLEEVQKQPFTVADLKVDGYEIMKLFNLKPGPKVGKILNELFNDVISEKLKNNKEDLLQYLRNKIKTDQLITS